jgi:hypothetical protein
VGIQGTPAGLLDGCVTTPLQQTPHPWQQQQKLGVLLLLLLLL